jgi:exoribonuclease-2
MGEIAIALLNKELKFCELSSESSNNTRIEAKVGRNKRAKIPYKNLIYRSGIHVNDAIDPQKFSSVATQMSETLDLHLAWELLSQNLIENETEQIDVYKISDLLDFEKDPYLIAAIYLHIHKDSLFFSIYENGLLIHSPQNVEAVKTARVRSNRENEDEQTLIKSIKNQSIPSNLSDHQSQLIQYLKNFVILGESYSRSAKAIDLINRISSNSQGDLQKTGFKLLEPTGIINLDIPYELEKLEISTKFSENLIKKSEILIPLDYEWEDLTHLPTYTIDDENTLDRDDAFSVDKDNNRIWIHITAVASIVDSGSIFDLEANNRMCSIYLPELTIPMLPRPISENISTLQPRFRRLCLSLRLDLDEKSKIIKHSFVKTAIETNDSLTYNDADNVFSNPTEQLHNLLSKIEQFTTNSKSERERQGAYSFNKPDVAIKISEAGKVNVSMSSAHSRSKDLIAELMIVYNAKIAHFFMTNQIPALYRSQDDSRNSHSVAAIGPLDWYLASRSMKPAKISVASGRHSGLGLDLYCQATSPLRRFTDLCLQRQAIEYISNSTNTYGPKELSNIGVESEIRVREIHGIESRRRKYWLLRFLEQEILNGTLPNRLVATVLENDSIRSALIELTEFPLRGRCLIPQEFKPGNECELKLNGVDLWDLTAQFSLL